MHIDSAVECVGLGDSIKDVQKELAAQHATVSLQDRRQQPELGRGQTEGAAGLPDFITIPVDHQV